MDFFWNMEENVGNFDEISQDASASERYKISKQMCISENFRAARAANFQTKSIYWYV